MPLQRVAALSRRPTGTRRTCLPRAPAKSCRSLIRRRSPTPCVATSKSLSDSPRPRQRHAPSAPVSRGRRWQSRPRRFSRGAAWSLAPRRRRSVVRRDPRLVNIRTDHLLTLVDDVGIVQHAHGVIPNRRSGYCVDDVARLAVVALELARRGDEQVWTSIVYRSLAFLQDATDAQAGMRNFMGYDRRWLDEPHLGDHVGRSVWALGDILSTAWVPAVVGPTRRLLDAIVGTLGEAMSLRTGAYAALGLASPRRGPPPAGRAASTNASRRPACERLRGAVIHALALVRGQAHLRQRLPSTRDDHRRGHARPTRSDGNGPGSPSLAR